MNGPEPRFLTERNREAGLYLIDQAACPYAAISEQAAYCDNAPGTAAIPDGATILSATLRLSRRACPTPRPTAPGPKAA